MSELPTEEAQLRRGFPVSNEDMFADNSVESKCKLSNYSFNQDGCNLLCSQKAAADTEFSARVKRTNKGYLQPP